MILRYDGVNCPVCGKAFVPSDDIVVCPRCGTPEHKDCWALTRDCVNSNRHDEGYIWQIGDAGVAAAAPGAEGVSAAATACPTEDAGTETGDAAGKIEAYAEDENGSLRDEAHNIHICHNCGAPNDAYEPVCVNCGVRLYRNGSQGGAYDRGAHSGGGPYRYGYESAYGRPDFEIDGIPALEVAAYVQQSSTIYINKFAGMDNNQSKLSWNWAAFFFPHYWLFYRKMYKLGALVLAILVFTGIMGNTKEQLEYSQASSDIMMSALEGEISYDEMLDAINSLPAPSQTMSTAAFALFMVVRIYFALNANALYRKKINEDITKIRKEASDSDTYFYLLTTRGGGSAFMMLLSVLAHYVIDTAVLNIMIYLLL